jgi:hypothetical protein
MPSISALRSRTRCISVSIGLASAVHLHHDLRSSWIKGVEGVVFTLLSTARQDCALTRLAAARESQPSPAISILLQRPVQ